VLTCRENRKCGLADRASLTKRAISLHGRQ
jgi:hypothetical protein